MGEICDNKTEECNDARMKKDSLQRCDVKKSYDHQACGFHLSRSAWDPYPWVSNVESNSPAAEAGLQVGDFVIQVNNEDILGLNIEEIAGKVRCKELFISLMVWKPGIQEKENASPAAFNLQKFSQFVEATVQLIECPVCQSLPTTPTYQCGNGHLLCNMCRTKLAKCPMCRTALTNRGRCLLAEKIHQLFRETFSLGKPQIILNPETFSCPWTDSSCQKSIKDSKLVWKHLKDFHDGPLVKYFSKSRKFKVIVPSQPCAIVLEDSEGNVFFVRVKKPNFAVCLLEGRKTQNGFSFCFKHSSKPVMSIWESWDNILNQNASCKMPHDATTISLTISQLDENKNKIC